MADPPVPPPRPEPEKKGKCAIFFFVHALELWLLWWRFFSVGTPRANERLDASVVAAKILLIAGQT